VEVGGEGSQDESKRSSGGRRAHSIWLLTALFIGETYTDTLHGANGPRSPRWWSNGFRGESTVERTTSGQDGWWCFSAWLRGTAKRSLRESLPYRARLPLIVERTDFEKTQGKRPATAQNLVQRYKVRVHGRRKHPADQAAEERTLSLKRIGALEL
jgi:hypothetical protein